MGWLWHLCVRAGSFLVAIGASRLPSPFTPEQEADHLDRMLAFAAWLDEQGD